MRILRESLLNLILLMIFSGYVLAIDLGDPAPDLKISVWVKGEPVTIKKGNIYVVEFWATWCQPCRDSIPHMSDIQKQFKDQGVIFIGITDESIKIVRPFVGKMAGKMDYVVAIDDESQTYNAYMEAFNVKGIPHAFVVDKNASIVWHGHPMQDIDKVIDRVLAGTYSIEETKQDARNIEKLNKLREDYLDLLVKDSQKAKELGNNIVKDFSKYGNQLAGFARSILSGNENRIDTDLALKAASTAYETHGKNVWVVYTYAWALFESGNIDEAIKLHKKAIEICKDDRFREYLEKRLELYENKKAEKH